jgi:hypothetical protein
LGHDDLQMNQVSVTQLDNPVDHIKAMVHARASKEDDAELRNIPASNLPRQMRRKKK